MLKYFTKFLIPKNTDVLPHTIKRNRIYILPTKRGIKFCLMLGVMFLVSLNNNDNLALLLTFILCSTFLISMIYTHSNLKGLKLISVSTQPNFASEKAKVSINLLSDNLARPLITAYIDSENLEKTKVLDTKTLELKAQTENRGIYRPEKIRIESDFPFSFFKAWTYIKTDVQCLVYPKPLENKHKASISSKQADGANNGGKGNEDFNGLKNYTQGDSPKKIYWKGLSKGTGLNTKDYSGSSSQIALYDFNKIKEDNLEIKLSMLSFLVLQAKGAFTLKIPGKTIGPDSGEKHLHSCLKELALYAKE